MVAKRFNSDGSEGKLGALAEDQIHSSIRNEAVKLGIGKYSDIFGGPTLSRYFILKLNDVRSAEFERLKEKRNEIHNLLTAEAFQHQIDLWINRKKQSSFVHYQGNSTAREVPFVQ